MISICASIHLMAFLGPFSLMLTASANRGFRAAAGDAGAEVGALTASWADEVECVRGEDGWEPGNLNVVSA